MKKILALLLTLSMVFALSACGSSQEEETPPDDSSPAGEGSNLVGVAMPTKDLQRWNQDGENMKAQLEEAGYTVDLQYAANDIPTQVSQIENMIANGCEALVICTDCAYLEVFSPNADLLERAAQAARAAGAERVSMEPDEDRTGFCI